MPNLKNILTIFAVLAAAVMVGCVIGWFGGRTSEDNLLPVSAMSPASVEPSPIQSVAVSKPVVPVAGDTNQIETVPVPPKDADTNWDEVVQAILDSNAADADKAKKLFALFPTLPPDEQAAVVENLSELVTDENYASLGRLLKDPKLPTAVLDGLMGDALGRPNSVKLPLMLEVAQNPNHAKAAEAKDMLETYLEKDYGNDWAQWRQQLTAWLKDNPD